MRSISTVALCTALALGAQTIPAQVASAEVAQQESSQTSSESPEIIIPIAVFSSLALVALLGNLVIDFLNRNTYHTLFTNVI